jgi:hypothetical protein
MIARLVRDDDRVYPESFDPLRTGVSKGEHRFCSRLRDLSAASLRDERTIESSIGATSAPRARSSDLFGDG